jgi:hypothetical protein
LQMMRQQLVENALRGRASPSYLVPPDCRDGGRLDLKPDIAVPEAARTRPNLLLEMRQAGASASADLLSIRRGEVDPVPAGATSPRHGNSSATPRRRPRS